MNDLPATLEQLTARLEELEQRISLLERPPAVSDREAAAENAAPAASSADIGPSFVQAGGLFSVLGRAMLGIAGAYVLRAVAESTSLPKLILAVIAIAYAILWLVWAVRVKAEEWLASTVYAGTSALILAPLLWELTLSFKVLAPSATAAILGIFVLAASALAWKRDLTTVLWVANVTSAITAVALAVATRQLLPFIAALLLMVLICEYAAELNHELTVRPFVAVAADLATWALIFIYSGPQSARVEYPVLGDATLLAPGCALFLIYGASIAIRTAVLRQNITIFETVQATIAFLLAASGVMYFEPQFGAIGLGAACLVLSASCYALVIAVGREPAAGRNYQVFAAWGTGLLIAGSLLSLPPMGLALCLGLGLAALALTVLGLRLNKLTLQIHGLVLLLVVSVASGMINYAFQALAGALPERLSASVCVAIACTVACYSLGKREPAENWLRQALHLVPAALAVCALAALLVQGMLALAAMWIVPDVYHIAFIRTLIICSIALAAAFAGSRWHRSELSRIAYATLALIAAKLVFEDLRHGHLEFIAASIFLFAVTLISVPRLARTGQKF